MKTFAMVQCVLFLIGVLVFSPLVYAQDARYQASVESEKASLSEGVDYEGLAENEKIRKEQTNYSPAWGLLGFGVFFFSLYFVMRREEFELVS